MTEKQLLDMIEANGSFSASVVTSHKYYITGTQQKAIDTANRLVSKGLLKLEPIQTDANDDYRMTRYTWTKA